MEKIKSTGNIEETAVSPTKVEEPKTDFEAMFAAMKKQMDEQAEMIKKQNETIAELTKKSLAENKSKDTNSNEEILKLLTSLQNGQNNLSQTKMVKVIHLDDVAQAMFKLQNGRTIKFTKASQDDSTYGKIVPVSEEDAILLLNEYESAFVRGALKFDEEHQYLLRDKGIDVDSINYKSMEDINKFEELDENGIVKLYDSLKAFQKEMLKTHIVNIIRHSKKLDETLVDKIKLLNRLSKKEGDLLNNQGAYDFILEKLREGGLE